MSNTPIQVTTDLSQILGRIEQKIDRVNDRIDRLDDKFEAKLEQMEARFDTKLTQLEARLEANFSARLAEMEKRFDERLSKIESKFDKVEECLKEVEISIAEIKAKIEGLDKRLETQEFVNRGILVGLILTLLGGFAKIFGLVGNP